MSQFCGKCDFYDGFIMIMGDGDEDKIKENLKKLKLYVWGKDGREHLVKSDTIKDITKYYPYLEGFMIGDSNGNRVVKLSSDSFIDIEERESIGYKVEDVMKYWRKCKREKKEFIPDECVEKLHWMDSKMIKEIANRVMIFGNKAKFDDLHNDYHELMRRRWFEEMVKVGYTELEAYNWCFKGFLDPEETVIKRLGRPLNKGEN